MLAERCVKMKSVINITIFLFILSVSNVFLASDFNEKLLLKLYQEEKMSHDLLGEYYDRWQLEVFNSVKERDKKHVWCMDMVINRYGYTNNQPQETGKFTDKKLQKIYNELTVKGSISDLSALEAAAYIKERSISKLRERIQMQSDPYIIMIIYLIEKAAQKQFRAFVESLKISGSDYTPVLLTEDEYNNIILPLSKQTAAGN